MSHLDIQALHIHHGVIEVIALSGDTDVTASSSGNTDAIKIIWHLNPILDCTYGFSGKTRFKKAKIIFFGDRK